MKRFWITKAIKGVFFVSVAVLLFGFITMHLWNCLVPALFNGPVITMMQAFGILILSKILFGGFSGGRGWGGGGCCGHKGGGHWREKWEQKMSNMSPEDKEKFKQSWRNKCGSYYVDEVKVEEEKK